MISAIHLLSVLVGLGALGMLAGRSRGELRAMRLPLALLLLATVTANVSELAEWSGAEEVARFGELLAILVPVTWLFTVSAGGLELALRRFEERERQLRLVFDHAVVPLALVDQRGRHLACSSDWARWMGVDDGLEGRPLPSEGALGGALGELLRTCLETGEQAVTSDPVAVRVGDREEWAQLVVAPWLEDDERPGGALAMVVPVTDAVERDAQLARDVEELQHRDRLELLGVLAAGVAHDLRNLLTPLSLSADIVLSGGADEAMLMEAARDIGEGVRTSTELIQTLTEMVQRRVSPASPLDLRALVYDSMGLMRRAASSCRVELEVEEDPYWVLAARIKLQQVLLNLVVNARDAMKNQGRVLVRVGSGSLRGRPAAVLEVHDDGPGMPDAVRQHAFDTLFTTKGSDGTGLGLAIVRSVVEEAGGVVGIDSEPGRGTTVRVQLPFTTAA